MTVNHPSRKNEIIILALSFSMAIIFQPLIFRIMIPEKLNYVAPLRPDVNLHLFNGFLQVFNTLLVYPCIDNLRLNNPRAPAARRLQRIVCLGRRQIFNQNSAFLHLPVGLHHPLDRFVFLKNSFGDHLRRQIGVDSLQRCSVFLSRRGAD